MSGRTRVRWTPERLAWARREAPRHATYRALAAAVSERFGVSVTKIAMASAARKHGGIRLATHGAQPRRANGQFPAGHVAWNHGTKGLTGRNRTSFRKGHPLPNRRPTGAIVIRGHKGVQDAFVKTDIPNPYTGTGQLWVRAAVVAWTDAHGPVPSGYVVVRLGDDLHDIAPERVLCVPRGVVACANRRHPGWQNDPVEMQRTLLLGLHVQWLARRRTGSQHYRGYFIRDKHPPGTDSSSSTCATASRVGWVAAERWCIARGPRPSATSTRRISRRGGR